MTKRQRRDQNAKAAESDEKKLSKAEASVAVSRFKNLTRDLLKVRRADIDAEQDAYERNKGTKPRRG